MTDTPSGAQAPLTELAQRFQRFAAIDGRDDPLYRALAAIVASRPALLALLAQAPATQQLPVLLLAALHERVLAGADHGLAAYFPSVGGLRAPDAVLADTLERFAALEREALLATLRTRNTQTNEIGRCAMLWPVLQAVAQGLAPQHEALPLALFDFGCSAGLNLGVADYAYDYQTAQGSLRAGSPSPEAPRVSSVWRGAAPLSLLGPARWRLAARLGVDLAPLNPADPAQARWLQACVWPHDQPRRERLQQALRQAQARPPVLEACTWGLDRLTTWLDELPPGVQPVLFNSWVLAYLDPSALARYRHQVQALTQRRGLVWISAEAVARAPLEPPPEVPAGESPGSATLWTVHWRRADGRPCTEALGWSHPHGRWLSWLDGAPA